ncbi:MAG: elongation factor P [candidate division WWE3 bacterium]|nr:elongation factor P [candidate division WWE3 bacterium]
MISVTELRKGTVFVEGGKPFVVVEYRHTKMGRGNASIKVKARDLISGSMIEKTFISGGTVEEGEVERRKAQYLYSDEQNTNFMDPQTFEQYAVPKSVAEDVPRFLTEGSETILRVFRGTPIGVELPLKVNLKVTDTPPGEKGDTKQGGSKEATVETGYRLQVPMFVKVGEIMMINTETGEYVGRA